MASGDHRAAVPDNLSGVGLNIGLVRARGNDQIVDRLADGVERAFSALRVTRTVEIVVPGCLEIPLGAKYLAESGQVDAVVCIGAAIRYETTHYDLVVGECGRGIQELQMRSGVPVTFGVLAVEDEAQATAKSDGPDGHNVGHEAALGAVEMARLAQKWGKLGK